MTKHFHNVLLGISVLPALLVMPAMADTVDSRQVIKQNTTYNNLTALNIASSSANNGGVFYMEDVQDVTLTFDGTTTFSGNSLTGPSSGMGGVIGNGWLSTHDVNVYPQYTPGGKIVFNGATTFTNNTTDSKNGAGAIFNYGLGNLEAPDIKFNKAVTFTWNSATGSMNADIIGGGAIHHRGGMIVFDDIANFNQNTSVSKGGAIISTGDMVFNDAVTFSENAASSSGGAIAAMGGHITFNDTATFIGNKAPTASAIFATGSSDITFNGAATFKDNTGTGVLVTNGSNTYVVFNNGATFNNNTNGTSNGALENAANSSICVNGGNLSFIGNTGGNGGGLQNAGNVTVNTTGDVLFKGNETLSSAGAFDNGGTTTFTANKISFIDNIANAGYGGAIFSSGDVSILGNQNVFTGNQAKDTGTTKSGGGAIHNRGNSGTATLVIGVTNGTNEFTSNISKAYGGAIVARAYDGQNQDSEVTINGTTTFTTNHADLDGGAIWNSVAPKNNTTGHANFVINGATTFTGNEAGGNGGAIYNNDSFAFNNNATFKNNEATGFGGAIYNEGIMQLANATFGGVDLTDPQNPVSLGNTALNGGAIYNAGTISLTGGSFVGNTAVNSGGAIENKDVNSALTLTNVNFTNNSADWAGAVEVRGTVNITGGSFTGNTSNDGGGAIYLATLDNKGHKLTIDGTTFTNNGTVGTDLDGGGAIGSFSDLVLRNATFTGNYFGVENVNTTADGGGAIMMGSVSTNLIENTTFTDNTSKLWGGAISMRDVNKGNNDDATLDMNNVTFTHNTAVYGGAIYNTFHNDANDDGYVSVNGATFNNNIATNNGGAIYNSAAGTTDTVGGVMQLNNSTFTGNTAGYYGGAIYNGGTLALAGTNTFIGNTANGHANDIDSHGTLNIASGTTTLSGGITGNGILNIADGATLNIGTASVAQNTINLNGTMLATLRSGDNAQITATSAFNGAGELKLAFDGEGLYHVFGGKVFAKENGIDLSSVVYDLTWSEDGKDVTASLKSVEDLAEENHLTTETAATIVNLTSSTSDVLNDLSVTIQEKLATGTEEARQEVEHAQVAINPEKESVVQSVTSSVQNAVSSLAMSRMSMPMGGRNGGDAKVTGRGVWVNGIFNKAKQNDAFNGYTRGFAAGLDGTINNKWTIGAGYSFAHSDVDGSARDTEIESSSVFVYGQYRRKAWYVNGVANYTMADYSEQGTALGMPVTADYDVKSYGANVATGYRFAGGITPELSLRYLHINESDYVNSLGIKNELKESDYLTASLGTKYAFRIKVTKAFRLRPELSYAVKYDMLSDKQVANVTMPGLNSYALNGDRLSRIAGEFGIGLGARYKGLDVSLNYDIEAREDYTSQSGRLKFRYNF